MNQPQASEPHTGTRLRLWPGIAIVTVLLFLRFGIPIIMPRFEGFRIAFIGVFLGAPAIAIWWMFFSRATRAERWAAVFLTIACPAITWGLNHPSMRLMWLVGFAVPTLSTALVVWATLTRNLPQKTRLITMAATFMAACGVWTLTRSDGMTGNHATQLTWRWTKTAEEKLLARDGDHARPPSEPGLRSDGIAKPSWPGFRGPNRDGVVPGTRLATDWSLTPPQPLWRRKIGPGWSSFAVANQRVYTQEQRGDEELVACYDLTTGDPVWFHSNTARFYESIGGPGPRATPTLNEGHLFTLGATGILNALNARDGTLLWERDVTDDARATDPYWGFANSPLVFDDLVIVSAAGQLVAYDRTSGERRWLGPESAESYSSPHFATVMGIPQVVQLSGDGALAVTPSDGRVLWHHEWSGRPMVQPTRINGSQLLINAGEGYGLRKISFAHQGSQWKVTPDWTSIRLKPNFNGLVVHRNHAFGFDGGIMACIELENGTRKWKGGRYGMGQLLLLPDQDLLLVISEKGELVLVEASTEKFNELGRYPAIQGKTWNHPALIDDILLIRNGQEMAAYRLPLATTE